MNNQLINIDKIMEFSSKINSFNDLKKNKMYKTLGVSPVSFLLLRLMLKKYLVQGEGVFQPWQLIDVLRKSSFFKKIFIDSDIFLDYDNSSLEEDPEDAFVNMRNYNELDFFEEDFLELNYIKYIESINELLNFGYISLNNNDTYHNNNVSNIFFLFTAHINLSLDFLNIVNNNGIFIKEYNIKKGYIDYNEYLKDAFEYINQKFIYKNLYSSLNKKSPVLKKYLLEYQSIKSQIDTRLSNSKKINNPMINFFTKNNLTESQQDIILFLYRAETLNQISTLCTENNLLNLYYDDLPDILPSRDNIFDISSSLIEYSYQDYNFDYLHQPSVVYLLTDYSLSEISPLDLPSQNKKSIIFSELSKIVKENDFEIIEPKVHIEDLVLSEDTNNLISILLNQLDESVIKQLKEWGIKNDDNINARILFSGKPGTGKTATSHAIGNTLNRFIVSFDCSKILDKYVGESEKNVKSIFETYRKVQEKLDYYPILLLNEADQFLSSRSINGNSGVDKMHNQMQNIFLEEIEKFEGILIATTNLKENLDKAFSRRFNYKIEFNVPDKNIRLEIWKRKISSKLPLEKDFDFNQLADYELTGGQIQLVIENTAMKNAVNKITKFSTSHFISEIKKELNSSFDKDFSNVMGFNLKS